MRVLATAAAFATACLLPFSAMGQEKKEEVQGPRVVEVEVTERGLIPSVIKLAVDEVIELRFARKSDSACDHIAIPARDEIVKLPAGQTVTHHFRGHGAGRYSFGCGQLDGVFIVE